MREYNIDAIHYSVRDNGMIRKLAAYVILGINAEGKKEVLTIQNWAQVYGELRNCVLNFLFFIFLLYHSEK